MIVLILQTRGRRSCGKGFFLLCFCNLPTNLRPSEREAKSFMAHSFINNQR